MSSKKQDLKNTKGLEQIRQIFGHNKSQPEVFSIFKQHESQSQISENSKEESSFELESQKNIGASDQQRQNIEKLLDRLGLKTAQATNHKNQELQIVVNNFVQNCIDTVDQVANIEEYDERYGSIYQEKLKSRKPIQSSIYISELTQLEEIMRMKASGLRVLYKNILLLIRYFSMSCEKIAEHPIFEGFILVVITLNSVKMATDDPLSTQTSLPWAETTFTVIYVLQMSLKIFAYGFILNKGSYLRDLWNIMDFFIVLTSLLPIVITLNFSVNALRAFRVLRPLRTVTKIKALKRIIKTLFYSFSLVMDSIYILLFVIFVLSIAGMQLFGGKLKYVCMNFDDGSLSSRLCSISDDCFSNEVCAKGITNPNFSIINFDTFLWSFLSVFQVLTLEGWSSIMSDIQHVNGFVYGIYFLLTVFSCQFILLNMTLAILKYKYSQVKGNTIEEQQQEKQEYEPQFLKKIGIFDQISVLAKPNVFIRSNNPLKRQVGTGKTLPSKESQTLSVSTNELINYLLEPRGSEKTIKIEQKPLLNVQQLKQIGRLTDFKWDTKQLHFQSNNLSEKEINGNIEEKIGSQKSIQKKQSAEKLEESFEQSVDETVSEESETDSEKEDELVVQAMQAQQRLNNGLISKRKDYQRPKLQLDDSKIEEQKKKEKIVTLQASDLDKLLLIIGGKPGMTINNNLQISLPEVDMQKIAPEQIYDRFADLGDFSIKRVKKKNELNELQIPAAKKLVRKQMKKKQAPIQAAIEEAALDLKELHLKNQLEKTLLRCRLKPDELLDKQRQYDLTRVVISLKMKQVEKKKQQINENLNHLRFKVTFKSSTEKKGEKQSIFARNLENEKHILKIPQIASITYKSSKDKKDKQSASSDRPRDNSKYLKLLQNYQIQDHIDLSLDRVMTTFFRKDPSKKVMKKDQQHNAEEEYQLIRQEDILKRHGRLQIQFPTPNLEEQNQLIESVNMRNQQYDINIRGMKGFLRVARKKTLLFVSSPVYDNFMLLIVLINTVLMSLSGFVNTDNPPYSNINFTFTNLFVVDLGLKIFAYGFSFFSDTMNLFDAGVVAVSMVQISSGSSSVSALRSIRILRAFRVLRVTRLIRSLSYMRIIMNVITSIITEFIYVFILLFLFIFIYTLLGMQIYGGNFVPSSVSGIRQNFDTFFNAFFTIFQVMTVQNWNDIITAVSLSSIGPWGNIFLISWIFLGNWILLSLLQAILLDGFDDDVTNPDQDESRDDTDTKQIDPIQSKLQIQATQAFQDQDEIDEKASTSKKQLLFDQNDASLFIFQPDHPLRKFAIWIIGTTVFEVVMFIIILLSSSKLAFDTYIDDQEGQLVQTSKLLDFCLNFIFIAECLLNIIARGFIVGQDSFLSNSWNKLDFMIVCFSIVDMIFSNLNLSILKLLRTLRPLRIITRNQQMKIMVTSLTQSIIGIVNLLIILLSVYLMFAILGMNLLQSKLQYCNVTGSQLITGDYGPYNITSDQCIAQGGVWNTQPLNFQNIGSSMLTLYIFATRENWPFYVFTFIDASETGPIEDNNQLLYFLYSIVFIFICSLFLMDLLVGVLFNNYHQSQKKIRPKTLSDKQINWKNLQKLIIQEDPCFDLYIAPQNGFRKSLFNIVSTKIFEILVALIIIFNIFVMCLGNDDISLEEETLLTGMNTICSYIFIGQLSVKLITYQKAYFLSFWNIFDFLVVSASVLDIILGYTGVSSGQTTTLSLLPQIARIFRVLRITRLLRMFKRFKGLQKLIETFIFSLPAISKAFSILLLYLFIASILASNLMGSISADYSGAITTEMNYKDFHHAIQTLFVNLTGQNWYQYMLFTTNAGYATCQGNSSSCISSAYYLFWLPFIFFGQKVFLELFVLIVLDQFSENYINQHNPLGIFSLYEENFRQKWILATSKYHYEKIEAKNLIDLMLNLKAPLGLARQDTLSKYKRELQQNDKIKAEDIEQKTTEMDQKLKKNAAILLNKMNLLKNRIYFGYHQTFYHFTKLASVPLFITEISAQQKQEMDVIHKNTEQELDKLKPSGNLFYYGQLEGQQEQLSTPLNPISLILFTQMIVKSWHNYSLRSRDKQQKKQSKKYDNMFDSLNNSCVSQINEAQFEKMDPDRRIVARRGGLMEGKSSQKCEFQPATNICGAYEEGRKTKGKLSRHNTSISKGNYRSSISGKNNYLKNELRQTLAKEAIQI